MKPLAILVCVLATFACTRMDQYFDGQVVQVNGRDFLVRQLSSGGYQAMPNDPELRLTKDPSIWPLNVSAIEKATNCKVNPASIKNNDADTIAAVEC